MSDAKTRSQAPSSSVAQTHDPKSQSPASNAKPAAKRPSWKETFPFYSGLLEIV